MPIYPRHIPAKVKLSPGPTNATFTSFAESKVDDPALQQAINSFLDYHNLVSA